MKKLLILGLIIMNSSLFSALQKNEKEFTFRVPEDELDALVTSPTERVLPNLYSIFGNKRDKQKDHVFFRTISPEKFESVSVQPLEATDTPSTPSFIVRTQDDTVYRLVLRSCSSK